AFHIGNERDQLEFDANPVTPFAFAKYELLIMDGDYGNGLKWIDGYLEGLGCCGRTFAECVIGADQIRFDLPVLDLHGNDLSAFELSRNCGGIVSIEGKGAVGPAQIGRAHAGERFPLGGYRGKVGGDAEDCVGNAVLVENLPECFSLSQLFSAAAAQGDDPVS